MIKETARPLLFLLLYWAACIFFFEAWRLVFLFMNYDEMATAGMGTAFRSLWFGLRMDMSAAAYITLPVCILVLLSTFIQFLRKALAYIIYSWVILFILLLIHFADIGLYKAWGSRIDATPLKYLVNPSEVWASIHHLPLFTIFIGFIFLYASLCVVTRRRLQAGVRLLSYRSGLVMRFIVILIASVSFIIPLRGGLQLAPINQSSVYFSQNNFANMAALNAPWNFLQAVVRNSGTGKNEFGITSTAKANAIADSLYQIGSSLRNANQKPAAQNVIVIVWESFTAKVKDLQYQGKVITPGFNALAKEGWYYANAFASGDRTDKGIVAILSGYPAQPTTSVIKDATKASHLPIISRQFRDAGYSTSFYYGGETEFANMKAYLLQGGFGRFVTINDFSKKQQNSKWGAHDGVVAEKLRADLQQVPQPFFTTWLTLTSHEPYEIPVPPLLAGSSREEKFLSSLHYSDSIVTDFIRWGQAQPWWKNTLVVIVADHGHRIPASTSKFEDFKIPLLFLGGVPESAPFISEKTVSQTDIAATVLCQQGISARQYRWSRNLLDSNYRPFAYFTFNNGFGFVQQNGALVYDNVGQLPIERRGTDTAGLVFAGRALQQAAFQDFLQK